MRNVNYLIYRIVFFKKTKKNFYKLKLKKLLFIVTEEQTRKTKLETLAAELLNSLVHKFLLEVKSEILRLK